MELSQLHTLLSKNLKDTSSIFQKFVMNCPEALLHLLDRCVIFDGRPNQGRGRVYLDFFLFKSSKNVWDSELAVANMLFTDRKDKLFAHALFDILIHLKWMKIRKFFAFGIIFQMIYMFVILGFSLINFSNLFKEETRLHQKDYWWFTLFVLNTCLLFSQLLKIGHLFIRLRMDKRLNRKKSKCQRFEDFQEFLSIIYGAIRPVLGGLVLLSMSRYVAACLILYIGWYLLVTVPTTTSQVMRTIMFLVVAYSPQIIAFAVAFHILLPSSSSFGSVDD